MRAPQADNTARASFGALALLDYVDRAGDSSEDLETCVADLLTDLRHLCDATGADFERALANSAMHHSAEIGGEL